MSRFARQVSLNEHFSSLELKSRKENFNRIMPDLEIDMHSNPFGDQNDPDRNFDQISVKFFRKSFVFQQKFSRLVDV